ncbi:nuclear transport factor 2 family protein [Amycolatopsis sp. MEPSY49]|uniref:nuclear transport factor 2 family protein n=1 Tax=Amycolatopsis sp. MEPSY49 TaxID=3151600 RepID=UPI003EF67DFC
MSESIDLHELPAVITGYLAAHQARDLDPALAGYTEDAVVTDEGRTHRGKQEIRTWLTRTASQYTYTTTLVAAHRIDDEHYVAVHHLEGDFPGGVADLRFRFTLDDDRIAELVIEP